MTRRYALQLVVISIFVAGCGRLKPVNLVGPETAVAQRNVIVFFVDGVNREVFHQLHAAGELPNIDRYLLQRGVEVENAVTVAPTITYAITTTMITGQTPGRHGILGNKYFDRDRLFLTDYNTIPTYRDTDNHYRCPTMYELLNDTFSVSIQVAMRRGVYRNIDNWATSGIRWYFNQITEIDALTAERFYLIRDMAAEAGRWPELIFAYFPATDEMGHRYGPDSPRYHNALRNADEQIGRICAALETSGLLEKTTLIFVSDHGMAPCPKENYLELDTLLKKELGLRLATKGPDLRKNYGERAAYFADFDAVMTEGGDRRAMVYLKKNEDWARLADAEQIESVAQLMVNQQAVDMVAYRGEAGVVVHSRFGRGLIHRDPSRMQIPLNNREYRYRIIDGKDPLGYADHPRAGRLMDGTFHPGKDWLEATVETDRPDVAVALLEMFDSRRTGDIVVFAAANWDFSRNSVAGHGGITAAEMFVPLIIAGPAVATGATIPMARTTDIAPTIVEWLNKDACDGSMFDGESIISKLRNK